ncbi:MAG: TetM/TetW/TetO/TetS family tetracycline resistance ribosomal protection protein [Oscillospiraceae bacterium]|nr:TetM/TetW/TetO/TetS family tetracycline resistance ribosomal protection protein [Oscillospiraceae bacterium]
MKRTIGIFAHVDAGKTTFSEQLLYLTGGVRTPGSVDAGTSHLDTHEIERERGITVFSGQARFSYHGDEYTFIDTPGHADFLSEAARTLPILDAAILLIGGSGGVQAHTLTLFDLLRTHKIPTVLFVNKTDLAGFSREETLSVLKARLSPDVLDWDADLAEFAAERDADFFEHYFSDSVTESLLHKTLARLLGDGECFPVLFGSAINGDGVLACLDTVSQFIQTSFDETAPFAATVYQIRHDDKGRRITFCKATSGTLRTKEFLRGEQVDELRLYQGGQFVSTPKVTAGEVFAALGPRELLPDGDPPYAPLRTRAVVDDPVRSLPSFRILEAEDPALSVCIKGGEIELTVSGKIHIEILTHLLKTRFGISATFTKPTVSYRETVKAPAIGFGHFEPLRHYAEVQLRLDPLPRGAGLCFASECPRDVLAESFQNLIRTHVYEKEHLGTLTGAPLCDVRVTLLDGRAHNKHTEGGDFREATYRAIRAALHHAESLLLEPYETFTLYLEPEFLGRAMSELQTCAAECEICGHDCIKGRAPTATLAAFRFDLASFTHGTGVLTSHFDGYEPCHNREEVLAAANYDPDSDLENPASSVFCAKGTSFVVPWFDAEAMMHTEKKEG